MPRTRIYPTSAERQKAYRERAAQHRPVPPLLPANKKSRQPSRPARLAAIEKQLRGLIEEFENWLESLPESLSDSRSADLLAETIDRLTEFADGIADIELPRGFGRD